MALLFAANALAANCISYANFAPNIEIFTSMLPEDAREIATAIALKNYQAMVQKMTPEQLAQFERILNNPKVEFPRDFPAIEAQFPDFLSDPRFNFSFVNFMGSPLAPNLLPALRSSTIMGIERHSMTFLVNGHELYNPLSMFTAIHEAQHVADILLKPEILEAMGGGTKFMETRAFVRSQATIREFVEKLGTPRLAKIIQEATDLPPEDLPLLELVLGGLLDKTSKDPFAPIFASLSEADVERMRSMLRSIYDSSNEKLGSVLAEIDLANISRQSYVRTNLSADSYKEKIRKEAEAVAYRQKRAADMIVARKRNAELMAQWARDDRDKRNYIIAGGAATAIIGGAVLALALGGSASNGK